MCIDIENEVKLFNSVIGVTKKVTNGKNTDQPAYFIRLTSVYPVRIYGILGTQKVVVGQLIKLVDHYSLRAIRVDIGSLSVLNQSVRRL